MDVSAEREVNCAAARRFSKIPLLFAMLTAGLRVEVARVALVAEWEARQGPGRCLSLRSSVSKRGRLGGW